MSTKQKFSLPLFILLLVLAVLAGILIFSASLPKAQLGPRTPNPQAETGEFDPSALSAIWLDKPIVPPRQPLGISALTASVLGESDQEKWIEVDLTKQRLYAHEGDNIIYEIPVSSGKFAPTPTGDYNIWYKVRYTKMEGGVKGTGTYYYLPNVPYTMFFYKGYGIHGTYWHNNFGQPMSHGCVNISISDAEKLFNWATPVIPEDKNAITASAKNPGTRVVVHGQAPRT